MVGGEGRCLFTFRGLGNRYLPNCVQEECCTCLYRDRDDRHYDDDDEGKIDEKWVIVGVLSGNQLVSSVMIFYIVNLCI